MNLRSGTKHEPTDTQIAAPLRHLLALLRHRFAALDPQQEHFHATFLDAQRGYLADRFIASGSFDTLTLRLREIFGRALALDANGLVIAHNHPSGLCRPSARDVLATQRLAEMGRGLDVVLNDHVILTVTGAYSMRAGGYL